MSTAACRHKSSRGAASGGTGQSITVCHNNPDFISFAHSKIESSNRDSVMDIISSLQDQINSLTSRMQTPSLTPPDPPFPDDDANTEDFLSTFIDDTITSDDCLDSFAQNLPTQSLPLYGLPTPDCGLNLQQSGPHERVPSILQPLERYHDDTNQGYGDGAIGQNDSHPSQSPIPASGEWSQLHSFRSLLTLREVMRLLDTYQEVLGDLHPIIDIDDIKVWARSCYVEADSAAWDIFAGQEHSPSDDDLLILNLVLMISLHADATSRSTNIEVAISETVQNPVNNRLTAPMSSIKLATIILLKVRSLLRVWRPSKMLNSQRNCRAHMTSSTICPT